MKPDANITVDDIDAVIAMMTLTVGGDWEQAIPFIDELSGEGSQADMQRMIRVAVAATMIANSFSWAAAADKKIDKLTLLQSMALSLKMTLDPPE